MDEDFEEVEYDERPEVKAFERAGPTSKLAEIIDRSLDDGKVKSADQRFYETVDRVVRQMMADNLGGLSENDINILLETAKNRLPGIKFKNPIGYIFGYVASKGGRSMEPDFVKTVIYGREKERQDITKLRENLFTEGGLKPPDIIKYGRLWLNLKD